MMGAVDMRAAEQAEAVSIKAEFEDQLFKLLQCLGRLAVELWGRLGVFGGIHSCRFR